MSTEDDIDCGHDSWSGLMRLLDEHWPDDIFHTRYGDDPARDAGPRIVSLIRVVDSLRANAERVRELEATVARVRDVLTAAERRTNRSSMRMFDGRPFPASIGGDDLRRALDGDR